MRRQRLFVLLPTLIALSLLAVLFMTTPVFAQDEQPPQPEENPAEVVVDSTPSEEAPEAELAPVLEEAAEAGITLVDGGGEPLALATEESAGALAGEKAWYKVGVTLYEFPTIFQAVQNVPTSGLPTDGMIHVDAGNYAEWPNIDGTADPVYKGLKGLIGTVMDNLPVVNLTGDITVNAVDFGFTIKGFNISSTFSPGITITDSKGTIKIEDVDVISSGGPGISISNNNGAIILNRVDSSNNPEGGAWLENLAGTAGVTITNSSFDENDDSASMALGGLTIRTKGAVLLDGVSISRTTGVALPALSIIQSGTLTIKNSILNNNASYALINDYSINPAGAITLQNVYAQDNYGGIQLYTKGNISFTGVHADGSTVGEGATLDTCQLSIVACSWLGTGAVTIKDSSFDNNSWTDYGLRVRSRGAITLTNVSASGNTSGSGNPDGAQLDTQYSQLASAVSVTGGIFNDNDGDGVVVTSKGAITLNKVHAGELLLGNGMSGAILDNRFGTAGVTITGSAPGDNTFNYNSQSGLEILTKGAASVKYTDSKENDLFGLRVINDSGTGPISISKSSFGLGGSTQNHFWAIYLVTKGNVTISDVTASSEIDNGLYIYIDPSTSSTVSITNGNFNYCGGNGLLINGQGNITLNKVNAYQNDLSGVWMEANKGNIIYKFGYLNANVDDGLHAYTKGTITISDLTSVGNGGHGADLQNQLADTPKAVTVTNGSFGYNDKSGLNVLSKGAITLKNVNATNNNAATVDMGTVDRNTWEVVEPYSEDTFTFTGPASGTVGILVNSAGFYGEMWLEGCGAISTHYIETDPDYELYHPYTGLNTGQCTLHIKDTNDLTGGAVMVSLYVDMPVNILPTAYGAFLDNHYGTAGITIANPTLPSGEPYTTGLGFSMNAAGGLELRTNGAVTLTNIWAGRNAGNGIDIQNHDSAPPYTYATNVTLTNLRAWDNYSNGLYVKNKGTITLTNAAGGGKWGRGAYLNNQAGTGNITIKNNPSTGSSLLPGFDNHTAEGVYILTHSAVTLTNVNFVGNILGGLEVILDGLGAVTLTNCREEHLLTAGSAKGISIQTNGPVVVKGGYSNNNTDTGLFINNAGGSGKPVSISNFWALNNKTTGVSVTSTGAITLFNVAADDTLAGSGVVLDNSASTAGIILTYIEAVDNIANGIDIMTQGMVSIKSGHIVSNDGVGIQINQTGAFITKALTLSDLEIYSSAGWGLIAEHVNGSITATNINCSNNTSQGGVLLNNTACSNCPVSFLATGTKTNDIHNNHGTGLSITTNGAVTLNKVLAGYNNPGYGVYIENNPGPSTAPKVTINNSDFNGNAYSGMYIVTAGIITLNNVESSDNGQYTYLSNFPDTSGAKGVNVFKSRFNRNGSDGLRISTHGAVVINKIEATGNLDGGMGVWITNNDIPALAKPVSILSTYGANVMSSNDNVNLYIESSGSVVLNNVIADSSVTNSGIYVDNSSGIGIVTLTNVTTRYNNLNGIAISTKGNVTLNGVNSLFNSVGTITRAYSGIFIGTNDIVTAKVTISNSLVSGNADYGIQLDLNAFGPYTLTNVYYFGNDTDSSGDYPCNLWVN